MGECEYTDSRKFDELVVDVVVEDSSWVGTMAMGLAYMLDEIVLELGGMAAVVAPEPWLLAALVALVSAQVLGPNVQPAASLALVFGCLLRASRRYR